MMLSTLISTLLGTKGTRWGGRRTGESSQLLQPLDDQGEDGEDQDRDSDEEHIEHEGFTPRVEWFSSARAVSRAAPHRKAHTDPPLLRPLAPLLRFTTET